MFCVVQMKIGAPLPLLLYPHVSAQECLAQQGRVARKANEYRLFAHGIACYFIDRLSHMPALEVRAASVTHGGIHRRFCLIYRHNNDPAPKGPLSPPIPYEHLR